MKRRTCTCSLEGHCSEDLRGCKLHQMWALRTWLARIGFCVKRKEMASGKSWAGMRERGLRFCGNWKLQRRLAAPSRRGRREAKLQNVQHASENPFRDPLRLRAACCFDPFLSSDAARSEDN